MNLRKDHYWIINLVFELNDDDDALGVMAVVVVVVAHDFFHVSLRVLHLSFVVFIG